MINILIGMVTGCSIHEKPRAPVGAGAQDQGRRCMEDIQVPAPVRGLRRFRPGAQQAMRIDPGRLLIVAARLCPISVWP